jgi:UDP-glucose 4-epimerase
MKIVVTGASSFVGFHLVANLLSDNHQVIGISRNRNKNIEDLLQLDNFTHCQYDISESSKVCEIAKEAEVIYHLAAVSSERLNKMNPPQSVKVNILGTVNMLEAARAGNSLFIFSSSGSVYPDSDKPKKEEEAAFTDRLYGVSKLTAERYCRLYRDKFGLNSVILRFTRIYGPRMMRNPIYDMSLAFAKKEPVVLYEDPSSEYDFIYVQDAINALGQARSDKWKNKIVNISSNSAVELKQIYNILKELTKFKPAVKVAADKKGTDILENRKAKELGWRPEHSLKEGLEKTLQYFKNTF